MLRKSRESGMDSSDDLDYEKLAWHDLNGRQIRNAVMTGRQLAQAQGERLSTKHFEIVLSIGDSFNEYLKAVLGNTAEEAARESRFR